MAELINQFSWSKSRHDLFKECERKYYFNYYGSWNGWKSNAEQRTRRIYYLKKLQTRHMWIGSAVHLLIEKVLKNHRLGQKNPGVDELQSGLLAGLRADFVDSRAGNWAKKKWRLLEHEYDLEVADEEWKAIADQAQSGFQNFWESEIYRQAQALDPEQWLEIEDFSHFYVDDVKVHVVLDFSFRKGDEIHIYDWKTGKGAGDIHALQLACYRMYAHETWQAGEDKVVTVEFNVTRDETKVYDNDGLSTDEALQVMKNSMERMKAMLVDVPGNRANEEDFSLTDDPSRCRMCNFKGVCPRGGGE